ncbi:MAG: Bacterial extracellular solute-binding protein [candidate division WS2 bacterium ADurb.Bin280]|uniref:Bacterial extracellular solute-binding protein n=1 Tax=candidate division WS2 bacterium ADurb.Bin280 TaxID=1852829 RepID=A0A1V5SC85_9BACT|nr:MAG: Bacterial extracellular solute-binding protein [candidate division WS2 bacterium ADurb.Bin280]
MEKSKQKQTNRSIAKIFATMIASFLMAGALSGCSNRAVQEVIGNDITLYWWRSQEDANRETLETIAQDFASETGIKVEVVLKNPNTYMQEATEALASAQTVEDAPDILSVNAEDLPGVALQLSSAPDDLFVDQDKKETRETLEYVEDEFLDVVSKSAVLTDVKSGEGKLFGLPMGLDELVLYRNTALIDQAIENLRTQNRVGKQYSDEEIAILRKKLTNAPATWADLVEIAPLITIRNENDISKAAISMGTANNVERSYDILQTIMMQNGTALTNSSLTAATFDQSVQTAAKTVNPGEKALAFYLRFSNPNDPVYCWNQQMPNSFDAFKNEQSAMMIHYSSAYNILINEAQSLKSKIEISALPQAVNPASSINSDQIKTMAKMYLETAPSARGDAKRQQAAWSFIKYITSKSGSSTYLSAMKLPSPLKEGNDRSKFETLSERKTSADLWFKGNDATSVNKSFISMIESAQTGASSTAEALSVAANAVTTVLQSSKVRWAGK